MTLNQSTPFRAGRASALAVLAFFFLIGATLFLVLKWLFSATKDKEKIPKTIPIQLEPEIPRKPAETALFRQIPAENPAKSKTNFVPVPNVVSQNFVPYVKAFAEKVSTTIIPPNSAPLVTKTPAPVIPPAKTEIPSVKRRFVRREHLAEIFKNGARSLDRKTAVAELQRLGFSATASYAALSPDGRFSAWLQCAPDGIISWVN
jgi:hypothetical protein